MEEKKFKKKKKNLIGLNCYHVVSRDDDFQVG